MLFESVAAAGIGALISVFAARKMRRRKMDQSGDATQDWLTYSADREEYAKQMDVAETVKAARLILHCQYAGKSGSRRDMLKRRIPERRHRQAVHLLRTLHIYAQPRGCVPVVSERFALQRLDRHHRINAARIKQNPTTYVSP